MGDERSTYRITDLERSDRPRERLIAYGPEVLSNAELIAILLRTGTGGANAIQLGQRLLKEFGGLPGLQRAPFRALRRMRGVGQAKACQIKAAVEIGRRIADTSPADKPVIRSPEDAAALLMYEMSALEQEHLRVLLLDTRNRVTEVCEVYRGSLNSSLIRVAEIFRDAVRANAASVIIVHNHPSGDPTPSPEDVSVTRAIIEAGRLLDVEVLDHLVIGQGRFVSLKAKGLGFD